MTWLLISVCSFSLKLHSSCFYHDLAFNIMNWPDLICLLISWLNTRLDLSLNIKSWLDLTCLLISVCSFSFNYILHADNLKEVKYFFFKINIIFQKWISFWMVFQSTIHNNEKKIIFNYFLLYVFSRKKSILLRDWGFKTEFSRDGSTK